MQRWTRLATLRCSLPRAAAPLTLSQRSLFRRTPTLLLQNESTAKKADAATGTAEQPQPDVAEKSGGTPTPSPAEAELAKELAKAREANAALQSKIDDLTADVVEWKDTAIRERADAENARRIAKEDVASERVFGIRNFAKDLLDIPDTFEKALELAERDGLGTGGEKGGLPVGKFVDGINGVHRALEHVLERHGVKVQPVTAGETLFNPAEHDAITLLPSEDMVHHTIMNVFQKGYVLKDRVLRAAKVVVADNPKKPAPQQPKAKGEQAK